MCIRLPLCQRADAFAVLSESTSNVVQGRHAIGLKYDLHQIFPDLQIRIYFNFLEMLLLFLSIFGLTQVLVALSDGSGDEQPCPNLVCGMEAVVGCPYLKCVDLIPLVVAFLFCFSFFSSLPPF